MNQHRCREVFARLRKENPHPTTELEYSNTYQLLVAVALSAQATDVSVNKATRALFRKVKTPRAMLRLGEAGLKDAIRTIGLYNTKAKNVIAAAQILVDRHQGKVLLNTAFGQPTIAVDTHIFRVANRTGLAPGKTVAAVEHKLLKRVPEEFLHDAHHWLILHGRYTCLARSPRCGSCIIEDLCDFPRKTEV
jgi:endonuclease-3